MTRQMFQEMHLDEIRRPDTLRRAETRMSFTPIYKEVKIAFHFVDTLSTGWVIYPTAVGTDTIPVVNYTTRWAVGRAHTQQFYNYLLARLATDTVALIKK